MMSPSCAIKVGGSSSRFHQSTARSSVRNAPRYLRMAWHVAWWRAHGVPTACAWHVRGVRMACAWRVHGMCVVPAQNSLVIVRAILGVRPLHVRDHSEGEERPLLRLRSGDRHPNTRTVGEGGRAQHSRGSWRAHAHRARRRARRPRRAALQLRGARCRTEAAHQACPSLTFLRPSLRGCTEDFSARPGAIR